MVVIGKVASKHSIGHHTDLPHISRLVVLILAAEHFRRLIDQRSHAVSHALVVKEAGCPEVDKLDLLILLDHDVIKFDVPVTYSPRVAIIHCQE